jgi:hypothetical protein
MCGRHRLHAFVCVLWSTVVPSLLQKITYEEFLPALMGHKLDAYAGYDSEADPRVSIEFSTAGFRLGHSLVNPDADFFDDNAYPLFPVRAGRTSQALAIEECTSTPVLQWLRL